MDCRAENVFYAEIRFAPQLHVSDGFQVKDVLRAVCRCRGAKACAVAHRNRAETGVL